MPYLGRNPDRSNFSDLNGDKLIIDADADTSIHASTDDQIDIEISGADDFRFTANTFTVLSGSTLTVASGATIANSGTATGFGGSDPSSADGDTLGTASLEWSDLYLADGSVIYFGNDQEVKVTHVADVGLAFKHTAAGVDNPIILTLQTGKTNLAADEVIGKIAFQAPDEGTGTDAILVAAAIQARSEGDFAADANATSIDFMVGASEAAATKMTLNSTGNLLISDGTSSLPSLTNTGDLNTGIYFPAADTVGIVTGGTEQFRFGSNPTSGFKNLWHNGDFKIAQRGTSKTGLGVTGGYQVHDGVKFQYVGGETGRYTASQSTTVPANTGHRKSFKIDVTTVDSSIASAHIYYLELPIEAQECSHLKFGESGALPLTISFWTRSTTTGDYQFMIQQLDTTRQYSTTYNIASADTWEKKTITIAGDTSGVINDDNGIGLTLTFTLTGGSNYQGGTEDAWASNNNNMYAAGMSLNLFSSTSNDWYIAGLQVEVGSVATDFEFEPHSVTLNRCLRYFSRLTSLDDSNPWFICTNRYTTMAVGMYHMTVPMRAGPTVGTTGTAGDYQVRQNNTSTDLTSVPALFGTASTRYVSFDFTISGGPLVAGESSMMQADDDAYLDLIAEL